MTSTKFDLLAAGQDLLWERGYAAMSPKAILARANAGQGSMYHHFSGKEDLAINAFARNAEDVVRKAELVLDGPGSPLQRLINYLHLNRDVLRGCPLGRMSSDHEVLERPALQQLLERSFEDLRRTVAEQAAAAIATGECRLGIDPDQLADMVLAVVQGGYVLARAAGDRAPFDRAVSGVVTLLESARDHEEDPS